MSTGFTEKIDALKPFVNKFATHVARKGHVLFPSCLRSSFVRNYEFLELASDATAKQAYFLVPNLRAVTEDLVYLRYLSKMVAAEREVLLQALLHLEYLQRSREQELFFASFRPFQPVARLTESSLEAETATAREIWRRHGFTLQRSAFKPNTRDVAKKIDPGSLEIIYDFLFRLTSGSVHFNPQLLLRQGWGDSGRKCTFSTSNLGGYHLAVSQIYGSYLFCLYFEFFGRFLRPDKPTKDAVASLRTYLLEIFRWPEMVTFEELNWAIPKPDPVLGPFGQNYLKVLASDGFIRGSKHQERFLKSVKKRRLNEQESQH